MQNTVLTFGPVVNKIDFIKALRMAIPGLGLVEAKHMLDSGKVEVPANVDPAAVVVAVRPYAPDLQVQMSAEDMFYMELRLFRHAMFMFGAKLAHRVNNVVRAYL
jgi:hypothetical protein